MSRFIPILCASALLCSPAFAAGKISTVSPANHEPVKFSVQNADPSHFTINLKKVANLSVNQDTKTYALYKTAALPDRCGNFLKSDMDYQKPDKYHRIFDLSQKPEVLKALDKYGCVVIPNKPKKS